METITNEKMEGIREDASYHNVVSSETILRYTFTIVPIVAGADKFFNLLTDWEKYLHPGIVSILPFSATTFMVIVGIIEIIAGILVMLKPKIGAYVVSLWLIGIVLNLILSGDYLDIAVRDLVMAISAFVLARMHND